MTRLPGIQRREQLLDCAADVFATQGYARATTAQLAKAAGVTEPVIYRHFKSKKDLFVALIERTAQRTLEQWERELSSATDSADRLRRLLGENPMVRPQGRGVYRVILQSITEVDDPDIQTALARHMETLHAFLLKEVSQAQTERKVSRIFSADITAWLLIHVGLGFGVLAAMGIPAQGADGQGVNVRAAIARLLVGRARERRA